MLKGSAEEKRQEQILVCIRIIHKVKTQIAGFLQPKGFSFISPGVGPEDLYF